MRHPNIITTLGVAVDLKPQLLVLEYMHNQSLSDLLHRSAIPFEASMLLSFARDVVEGMVFLHEHSPTILHGSLSTKVLALCVQSHTHTHAHTYTHTYTHTHTHTRASTHTHTHPHHRTHHHTKVDMRHALGMQNILVDDAFRCKLTDFLGMCTSTLSALPNDPYLPPETRVRLLLGSKVPIEGRRLIDQAPPAL